MAIFYLLRPLRELNCHFVDGNRLYIFIYYLYLLFIFKI